MDSRKYLVLAMFFLAFPLFSSLVFAVPAINSIEISPSSDIWIGENPVVTVNCSDSNGTIDTVFGNLSKSGSFYPVAFSIVSEGIFQATLSSSYYFPTTGSYLLNVYCNSSSGYDSDSISITASNLSGSMSDLGTVYGGSNITMYFDLRKNGVPIVFQNGSDPSFHVYVDGSEKSLLFPVGHEASGWKLVIGTQTNGPHTVSVVANYSRASASDSKQLQVSDITLISINPASMTLNSGDIVTVTFNASRMGVPITDLNSGTVSIDLSGGISFNLTGPASNIYTAKFNAPSRNSGKYDLVLTLSNYNAAVSIPVYYKFSVNGTIKDSSDKAVSATLTFTDSNSAATSFTTSGGVYSGLLNPGTYKVNLKFSDANLTFDSVYMSSFNDPVRYDHITDTAISGINSAGVFFFDFDYPLKDYTGSFELFYNKNYASDEESLKVYYCDSWNFNKRSCTSYWEELSSGYYVQNTYKHSMVVSSSKSGAYAIGTRQNLSVTAALDKEKYSSVDTAKLTGIVQSETNARVSGASVKASITGTGIQVNSTTNSNGEFTLVFPANLPDGSYVLNISITKSPFGTITISKSFDVAKKKEVVLTINSSLRVARGNVLTQEIEAANLGQVKLTNISFSISGISTDWYTIDQTARDLDIGDLAIARILFNIPQSANITTTAATLIFSSNELHAEKKFGFSVMDNETAVVATETQTAPSGSFLNITMPYVSYDYVIIAVALAIIAVIIVSFKPKGRGREEIKSALSEAKGYLDIRMKPNNNNSSHSDGRIERKYDYLSRRGIVNG